MLIKAIIQAAKESSLEASPNFIEKVLQLNDTINIRHANMLIGPTAGGKTTVLKTLAKALSSMPGQPKINMHCFNPKSATMN